MNQPNGVPTDVFRLRDGRKVLFGVALDLTGARLEVFFNEFPPAAIPLLTGALHQIVQHFAQQTPAAPPVKLV